MERLTERNADGSVKYAKGCYSGCEYLTCSMEEGYQCNHQCEADVVYKLADYEDAEEQGLLLRLPCKVGDVVYSLTPFCEICEEYLDNEYACECCCRGNFVTETKFDYEMIRMFGKTVFLTKEEAEQALKQIGE